MAKKKKTKIQPVSRGFATVSTPKQKVEEEPVATIAVSKSTDTNVGVVDETHPEKAGTSLLQEELDTSAVEERSLQNLVDKLQERVEKEVVRTVKAIETDRRAVRSFQPLHLAPELVESALGLLKESQDSDGRRYLTESEDKALFTLAVTYGVLRRIGYPEYQVEECLQAISGNTLDEALEWLYTHHPAADSQETPSSTDALGTRGLTTPQMTPVSTLKQLPKAEPAYTLNPKADTFVPSSSRPQTPGLISVSKDDYLSLVADPSTSTDINRSRASATDASADDLYARYVETRLRIDACTATKRSAATQTALKGLRNQLEVIKRDYFFDEIEGEALYKAERDKVEAAVLQAKLRGQAMPQAEPHPIPPPPPVVVPDSTTAPGNASDVFDGDEESEGGLFELLEPMPDNQTAEDGTVIKIRDMALSKNWSGRTPKKLLAEIVNKADRYAVITYGIISGSSRAKRAAVSIRWEGQRACSWSMEDVACYDETQAEQFVSTIAFHAITFPKLEGFAASASSQNATSFRLLPAVFRELWEELENQRKIDDDTENRNIWAKLKSIIEPKLGANDKTQTSNARNNGGADVARAPARSSNQPTAEDLMDAFAIRQSSAAYQTMLVERERLPIASHRHHIVETLANNQVLVLCGETGCGKSTQVPSFLLEEELRQGKRCKIICTEPRRISAISLAQRVSVELGDSPNAVGTVHSLVGYAIRLESNTSKNTRLTFMTNGIALRMLESGSGPGGRGTALDEITHIIIDEVHERTIESDFLLIVLKSLLEQRPDLKVILMSATVDAEKLSAYFGGCPVITVPGRTFPVEIKYLEDAIQFTHWTITDSSPYARRGHDKFYSKKNEWSEDAATRDDDDDSSPEQTTVRLERRYSADTVSTINLLDERTIPYPLIVQLLERICLERTEYNPYSQAVLVFMPGLQEIRRLNDMLVEHPDFGSDDAFRIYPLHSALTSGEQSAVFDIPPPGIRKIVIATNIAETGVTIPDITCVIDSGKHREMRFDEKRQISRLIETFIAKSNAAQRCGRAGRVRKGLAFRLFTKLKHDTQLADHPLPEIMRLSLSDLALRIKILKVNLGATIDEALSRALDPPAAMSVQRAVANLKEVRALTATEELTPLGRVLSKLPTDVALGKFLCLATLFQCLDPALTIAAALNLKSPFVKPFGLEKESDAKAASFAVGDSDFMTLHNVFSIWRRICTNHSPSSSFVRTFCRQNYLSIQVLAQIEELRQQFLGYLVDSSLIHVDKAFVRELSRARSRRYSFINVPEHLNCNSNHVPLLNSTLAAGLYPKLLSFDATTKQLRTITNNQSTAIHPSSVNHGRRPGDLGSYLVYFTIMHSKRLYAWETAPVMLELVLPLLCGEAEFKLSSGIVTIADRNLTKLKFKLTPQTCLAVKVMRDQLGGLLAQRLKGKPLVESQLLWQDLAMQALGKVEEVEARVVIS